jgi:3-hydroxyisobutyrate dehydrogenase-like beta-hydroxyacid dehydrogenase
MSRKLRKNVGLIGLGIIGSRVATGLRAAGYQVYVWNRSARATPNFLGSPAEIAEAAEIIQVFVADSAALFDVIEAFGESLTSNHVFICNSTVGPEAVMEAAQLVTARGAQFLDAPFTGSKLAAEKRELIYYIGGSDAAFLRAKPVLEATSKAIVRIGEIGHASTVKVVTNMISAVTVQTLAEALAIVLKAGLPAEALAAAIEHNACRSGVIDMKLAKMISGNYEPHFSLKHMFKDVQLGIHMANALDLEIPATTVTAGVMYGALSQGWADLDFSALFKTYLRDEGHDEQPTLDQQPELPTPTDPPPPLVFESNAAFLPAPEPPAPMHDLKTAEPPVAGPGGNGSTEHETQPATESANMIEAVLAQTNNGRTETAATSEAGANTLPAVEEAADVEGKHQDESSAVAAAQPAPVVEDSSSQIAAVPNPGDPEAEVRPINYVRRWFVARIGG